MTGASHSTEEKIRLAFTCAEHTSTGMPSRAGAVSASVGNRGHSSRTGSLKAGTSGPSMPDGATAKAALPTPRSQPANDKLKTSGDTTPVSTKKVVINLNRQGTHNFEANQLSQKLEAQGEYTEREVRRRTQMWAGCDDESSVSVRTMTTFIAACDVPLNS